MAGHSKFSNIKRKKEKADQVKGKLFTRIGREIAVAVRAGGADPETNNSLRDAIAKAKASNMPNDTIERSIKKASGGGDGADIESITYEGYGPNGTAIIVEAMTDNKNRAAANVRSAFTKGGGNLGTTGCVSFMFDKKGLIMVEKADDVDEDELMMTALEAGAEDFETEEEGYEIVTDPDDFSNVREALEAAGINMISAEITMLPQTYTEIKSKEDMKGMRKLLDLLDEEDDVQNVYHNWENEDEEE